MIIEPIFESDLKSVVAVIEESFLVSVASTWSEDATKTFLEKDLSLIKLAELISKGCIALKATDGGMIFGVLLFASDSKLAHLFVKPSAYGKGIAKQLFWAALNHIKDDIEYISLSSTEVAVKVYEKLGFKKSASAFKYNGCIFQPMVYWLGQHRLAGKVEFVD